MAAVSTMPAAFRAAAVTVVGVKVVVEVKVAAVTVVAVMASVTDVPSGSAGYSCYR